MIIDEINITINKNIHDIQSIMILIGILNVIILIKGISIEINIFFCSINIEVNKGNIIVAIIYILYIFRNYNSTNYCFFLN